MEHTDVSNQSLAAQEAEINRFVIRTTDLKDPVPFFLPLKPELAYKQIDA